MQMRSSRWTACAAMSIASGRPRATCAIFPESAPKVLVLGAAEDDDHGVVAQVGPDGLDQGLDGFGRVRPVEDDAGGAGDDFQARGLGGAGQALGHVALGRVEAPLTQLVEDRQRQAAVLRLVLSLQRHGEMLEDRTGGVQADAGVRAELRRGLEAAGIVDIRAQHLERGAGGLRCAAEDLHHGWRLRDGERGDTGLEDPGFFGGDLLEGVAQELRVLELDGGDGRDIGTDQVCGVEPSAQAHFHDGDIHRFFGEVAQRHGRQDLEIAHLAQSGIECFRGRGHLLADPGEL
jgi:hypothetical protein